MEFGACYALISIGRVFFSISKMESGIQLANQTSIFISISPLSSSYCSTSSIII
ncbi:uncharacterized protein DS421_18g609220 [Arachis hypogaea]|nr:uncharacterized protein DS421_18g609220 [Arachis hypogaea]